MPMKEAVIRAIQEHPAICQAAITGSHARGVTDRFSDLDVLLVASDLPAVRDVPSWLPAAGATLISAFHLNHYCTVLLSDFQKIDLAIFEVTDSPSIWVVHDFEMIKGGADFETQLAEARKNTHQKLAAHLHPDVSSDNLLLLLVTAHHRAGRGELLSAHRFLGMACEMVIALETRRSGVGGEADLLDPQRRLERLSPTLAAVIHESLFCPPAIGILHLAEYLTVGHPNALTGNHRRVLDHLIEQRRPIESVRQWLD
jgi:hypothetical protein